MDMAEKVLGNKDKTAATTPFKLDGIGNNQPKPQPLRVGLLIGAGLQSMPQ
jgi:hypothetical protein